MISVIVPAYNVEAFLKNCIESILKQSYQDFEIIAIDDGSTDNTGKILDSYSNNPKIKVIHQTHQGNSCARNAGLEQASGDYIMYIDSDGELVENALEELSSAAREDDADMVLADYVEMDENGVEYRDELDEAGLSEQNLMEQTKRYKPGQIDIEDLLAALTATSLDHYSIGTVVVWNKLIKRSVALKNRFLVGMPHEDEFWIMPTLLSCEKIVWTDSLVYKYRIRKSSLMRSDAFSIHTEILVLDAYENRIKLAAENGLDEKPYAMSYLLNLRDISKQLLHREDVGFIAMHKALAGRTIEAFRKYGHYFTLRESMEFLP